MKNEKWKMHGFSYRQLLLRNGKVETSQHNVQAAHDSNKVISQAL